jgi:hypothetical protein
MALVTRDRLLTVGMLALCALAAFFLVRSDVVESLLGQWARLRTPKPKPKLDFAPYPKPPQEPPQHDEDLTRGLMISCSDSSEMSQDLVVDEDPTESDVGDVDVRDPPFGETAVALSESVKVKVQPKRAPRKPRVGKSKSS